jgi:hypothetical protein
MKKRGRTSTSNLGSERELHDASAFYDRFRPPTLSTGDHVPAPALVAEPVVHGDTRRMDKVAGGSHPRDRVTRAPDGDLQLCVPTSTSRLPTVDQAGWRLIRKYPAPGTPPLSPATCTPSESRGGYSRSVQRKWNASMNGVTSSGSPP